MDRYRVSLSGTWDFLYEGESKWREILVPGCWETLGDSKRRSGPAWYRKRIVVPSELAAQRLWLCFQGVSYHCIVYVDGEEVGSHTGIWDAFRVEITDAVEPGEAAEISVRVTKPAGLEAGPDSPGLEGDFPLRETLAGFLPYVWGNMFGGLWQDVFFEATGSVVIEEARIRGDAQGCFRAHAQCSEEASVVCEIFDPEGKVVNTEKATSTTFTHSAAIADPQRWSPLTPALYRAQFTVENGNGDEAGDSRSVRFGFRSLQARGSTLLLNGTPIYPRMVLSWGWYPWSLNSNPGLEQVRSDWLQLRSLGYNGVKFCLWVPPRYYFDLADETGMLLWLEFPMWLPKVTERFRRQAAVEYKRITRELCSHPSIVLYSLGCELNKAADPSLLESLYVSMKAYVGDALVRDNSGSGEAYDGLLDEFADYYDYHFYCEPQFFRLLVDSFVPRWRREQPWLFGEYCDSDTFRNLEQLFKAHGRTPLWWTVKDADRNPQGARWTYEIGEHEQRLRASGLWDHSDQLERISIRQALLHRKLTLELTRTYREISGYVVTGERDTPISTAGMFDDSGRLKFDPESFRSHNQETLLTLGWDRRRAWVRGGDRAAYWDTFCYRSGDRVRAHLICSHYGRVTAPAKVRWSVSFPGSSPFAEGDGRCDGPLEPGSVREVCLAEFEAPAIEKPARATMQAEIDVGTESSRNSWSLWFFPEDFWHDVEPFHLFDPGGRMASLRKLAPVEDNDLSTSRVVLAVSWNEDICGVVASGGRAVVIADNRTSRPPIPTVTMPFWRESVKIIEPHPAWGDFPHEGWVDLQFYAIATDMVLDTGKIADASPILRRLDARTMFLHDYAVEVPHGRGSMIVSSLRFDGGLGDQPGCVGQSPSAAYLLRCWLRYLQRRLDGP
jgi:hypothetical protein